MRSVRAPRAPRTPRHIPEAPFVAGESRIVGARSVRGLGDDADRGGRDRATCIPDRDRARVLRRDPRTLGSLGARRGRRSRSRCALTVDGRVGTTYAPDRGGRMPAGRSKRGGVGRKPRGAPRPPPAPSLAPVLAHIPDPLPVPLPTHDFQADPPPSGRDPRTWPAAGDLLAVQTPHGPRTWCLLAVLDDPDVRWRTTPAEVTTPELRDLALLKCGASPNGRANLHLFRRLAAGARILHVQGDPVAEWTGNELRWLEPWEDS